MNKTITDIVWGLCYIVIVFIIVKLLSFLIRNLIIINSVTLYLVEIIITILLLFFTCTYFYLRKKPRVKEALYWSSGIILGKILYLFIRKI